MGFLSRKAKPAPVLDEVHPIQDELEDMEQAVPAQGTDLPTAGPVAKDSASSSQAAGDALPSTPPADEASEPSPGQSASAAEAEEASPDTSAKVAEPESHEPERMMAKDLIAPSRHDEPKIEPEAEVATKHAEVIAFANQKGGVAKTTTTLNLAVAFAENGHRVLCIDLDPQGNLTMSQGIDPDKVEKSMFDVLVHRMPISEIVQKREIDVAVGSIDL